MISLRTYAKLNLGLTVFPPRSDGYHPIQSIFQTVSLFDTLSIEIQPSGFELTCSNGALGFHDNILKRVYESFQARILVGLRVHVDKKIPLGSGLGGASTNVAGFLVGLNYLLKWGLTDSELMRVGSQFGSDVPFFIQGGRALVTGIGDIVTPQVEAPLATFLLIYPGFGCSTPVVYAAFDQLRQNPSEDNDLEAAAKVAYPALSEFKKCLVEVGLSPKMTGSGATMYMPFSERSVAEVWSLQLGAKFPKWQIFCVDTLNKGWDLSDDLDDL